ncbi:hypothetical protein ACFO3D_15270 [Virgibacillus kekensis]|uniref:DUF1700 domain-containing protein n=1 Tax=Virgibacillus kekensis TaxID=202261 RepID=A0ABV9DL25_9BACI
MKEAAETFLSELEEALGNHPEKQQIMEDYRMHVDDLLQEREHDNRQVYDELVQRMGTPEELARAWRQETVTPNKMQWLFVSLNIGIFTGGIVLTFSYNFFQWEWAEFLWTLLTNIPFIIMVGYILFWGLLGYEIGKEFGGSGRKLLRRTFILSIVPNLLFMYLILFRVIPYSWFDPLLSFPFIMTCIIFTGFLYPVCLAGFRWGRKISV